MFDQATLAQLEAGYQSSRPQQKAAAQVAKPKVSGAKRLIAGALPLIGGAVGSVAGSFAAPVAGTAAGGAAGSALGAALKQRLLGEKTNLGEIGKEAALGAVPGVFKGASAAVKTVKNAKTARQATAADQAAQQIAGKAQKPATPKPAPVTENRPSLLSKLSTNRTRAASGIKTDPGVGGIERADDAAQAFQRLGITGTPEKQLRKINETMASHGKQVDDILAKNPIQLDGTAVKAQVAKAIEDPLKYADLDLSTAGAQKALNTHLEKFAQAKTAKEVNDYVKTLNKVATRAKAKLDKGGTVTDKEAAALAAKRSGDEVLSQYPEIAPLKRDMATLFERNADVTKASEKTVGIPILGLKSKAAAQRGAQISSAIGTGANKADKVVGNPGVRKVGGSLLSQLTTRAVAAPLMSDQPSNMPQTASTTNTNITTNTTPASNDSIPPSNTTPAPDASTSSFFSDPTQVEQAYLQAINSGDTETANALIKGFELFGQSPGGTSKPLSAEASKVIATANSGLQSLAQLEQMIESGGVPTGTTVPGRGLFGGAGQAVLGTSAFDAAADNVADAMVRARTGAAATKEELALYRRLLPQAFDPPEVRQQKMQTVRDYFSSIANRTGSAGTDLQAATGIE